MSFSRLSLCSFAILVTLEVSLFTLNLPFVLVASAPSINSDKEALIAFRSQLSLDPSNPISSWDQNSSPCNWRRVVCNKFGNRVIGLNLSSLELVGSISPHIGNLSFLQSLQLQNNQLTGVIPNEVCNLIRLKVLNLSSNNLEGSIPTNITRLRELRVMDIVMNKITGRIPAELSSLSKLQILNLGRNQLSGHIPTSIGNISSLTNLDLGTNTLSGPIPSELSRIKSLKHLDLTINNLTGIVPPSIYNMSSLVFLALASNQLWGELPYNVGETLPNLLVFNFCINKFTGRIPGSLHNLPNIQVIRMAHNQLTGTIPPGLDKLPFLKMYNIGYNRIVNSGDDNGFDFITSLANSPQLNFLAFDGNLLEGTIPESIGNLSKVLSKLYMGQNRIHGSIPSSIGQLTGLALLNMSHNEITGTIPSEIGHLPGLEVLDLAKNHISGTIPESLGNLKLNQLDLSGNNLVGQVPATFGGFSSLNSMDLSSNMLNGSIPKEILSIPISNTLNLSSNLFSGELPQEIELVQNTIVIDLSNNRLSGEIPSSISNCKSLEVLNMARNSFSGSIPSSLGDLQALQTIDLSNNQLSGLIPCGGVFRNLSRVSLQGNPNLSLHLACQEAKAPHHTRKFKKVHIIFIIVATLVFLFGVASFFYATKKRKSKVSSASDSFTEKYQLVKYEELRQATGDFAEGNLIGRGSFGSVFKGILKDNIVVAVKVLDMKLAASWKSFAAECEALRNVRHRNLVKLITSCSSLDYKNMEFLALVYELLRNGSLEDWIKGERKKENGAGLNLEERLNVMIDVACALDYLHNDGEVPVVHCDIKPSNILLDEYMTAKIGDFGLARLLMEKMGDNQHSISSSHVLKGFIGYMPPEYGLGVRPSVAGDTYSFGVTLLEIFTGKSPSHDSFTGEQNLIAWIQAYFPTQVIQALLDPQLHQQLPDHFDDQGFKLPEKHKESLVKIFEIGLSCTVAHPDGRITMREVHRSLKAIKNKLL